MVVLATAHPAKFPDAVREGDRRAAARCRRGSAICWTAPSGSTGCRNDIDALKAMIDERMGDGAAPADEQGTHMSEVKVTTLANGLRVAVDAMPEVESASLGIWVACGTRHESAELNGMAHMLEHMAFKGTKTRSARAIAEEIENVGGSLNAYTGREITAYHASVLKEDVALGVEMVADILRNSVFDPDELQRERGVILQEIGQALDTPDDLIFDQFQETALPGQPLGRPVLGTAESVEAIGRDDLFAYPRPPLHRLQHGAVGGGPGRARPHRRSRREAFRLGAAHAGQCRCVRRRCAMSAATAARPACSSRRISCWAAKASAIAIPTISRSPSTRPCSAAACPRACSSASARSAGLVYGIHCFNAAYADGGLFGIYAGTGEDDLAELVPAVCEEFVGVADTLNEAGAGARAQPDQGRHADGAGSRAARAASRRRAT